MSERKPRLTVAEALMFCEVDADIRRWGRSAYSLHEAFSDLHDGGLYLREIRGLIRKRLLSVFHLAERSPYPDDLLGWGSGKTVDLTDRAMSIFWPDLYAKRQAILDRKKVPA